MVDFFQLDYLRNGMDRQRRAFQDLSNLQIMKILQPYQPVVAGTIPIGIDVEGSDLDIICYVTNFDDFERLVVDHFGSRPQFSIHRGRQRHNEAYILGKFHAVHFEIEIFGQARPVVEQDAYRHMIIEDRLLREHGDDFRRRVIALKQAGVKTEPAFVQILGLSSELDPYDALLALERKESSESKTA